MMIDCTTCCHWDVFTWNAAIWHRADGGFVDEPVTEHVETCSKGLIPVEDGRTVGTTVGKCERYEFERQIRLL